MKRTTKRRLGMAGLVVTGMMVVVFVASTRLVLGFSYESHFASTMWMGYPPETLSVTLRQGVVEMAIPYNRSFTGSWKYGKSATPFTRILRWWPEFDGDRYVGYMIIPLWIPTLIIAIPSFILWRRNRKLPEGHCACGYNLTGNVSGVCPECGRKLQAPNTADNNDMSAGEDSSSAQNQNTSTFRNSPTRTQDSTLPQCFQVNCK